MRKEIIDYFRNNKDEMIKSISELVGVPSVRGEAKEGMPFGEKPAEVLELALKTADGFGFKTKTKIALVIDKTKGITKRKTANTI